MNRQSTKKQFKQDWHQFILHTRQLIQKIGQLEDNLQTPNLDTTNINQISDAYQRSIDDLMPTIKSFTNDIDECITRAEILALNGDAKGQKDLVINELTKVKEKFLTRINEFKVSLQASIGFFQNFNKLEEMIANAEKEYDECVVSLGDLAETEYQLKKHLSERESFVKLFNFTVAEGDEVIGRGLGVGDLRRLMARVGEMRKCWERMWEKKDKELRRCVESGQIMVEKGQIIRDLDLLANEVEHRRKNAGNSFEQVEKSAGNFRDITDNMTVSGSFYLNDVICNFYFINFVVFIF